MIRINDFCFMKHTPQSIELSVEDLCFIGIFTIRVMLQIHLVFILSSSKNNVII
jgi:hypothetical protein